MKKPSVTDQRLRAAVVFQGDASVMEQGAFRDVVAVPVRHRCKRFRDEKARAFLGELLGHGGNRLPKSKAGKPNLWLSRRSEWGAGEARQFFFCRAGRRATDLLAMHHEGFALIMLLE